MPASEASIPEESKPLGIQALGVHGSNKTCGVRVKSKQLPSFPHGKGLSLDAVRVRRHVPPPPPLFAAGLTNPAGFLSPCVLPLKSHPATSTRCRATLAFCPATPACYGLTRLHCVVTPARCVETRMRCSETRTRYAETRTRYVETRKRCADTRKCYVETRKPCGEYRKPCFGTLANNEMFPMN